jgi:hypothetical protein
MEIGAAESSVNAPRAFTDSELDALYAVGYELFHRDDVRRAADVFRFLLLLGPNRADTWCALAVCHERVADEATSERLYELGFRACASAELALRCARVRARSGDRAGAREMLAAAVEAGSPTPLASLAREVESLL